MIETYLAANFPDDFNSAREANQSFDDRSDSKGPEPEAIEIGVINGRTYIFVGLERFSGILVCDITNPRDVTIAGFGLNRNFTVEFDEDNLDNVADAGDLGPEGLNFVPANKSPNGKPLLIVANEVTGTTTTSPPSSFILLVFRRCPILILPDKSMASRPSHPSREIEIGGLPRTP